MSKNRKLSASLEDYLEAIHHIVGEKQAARAKDISRRLKVNNSSVTGALQSLSQRGLINYVPYDVITLTSKGKKAAKDVIHRHEVLHDFFVKVLAVDEEEAEKAACKMEHAVPPGVLDRLIRFMEFMDTCPLRGANWVNGFGYYCEHGNVQEMCERCTALCEANESEKQTQEDEAG